MNFLIDDRLMSGKGVDMENDLMLRCFALRNELMALPVNDPEAKEAWFRSVGYQLAMIGDAMELRDWMQFFAEALEEKHGGVNRDLCYYLIQERVRTAQRGGTMNFVNCRENHRLVPVAASGTAEECLYGHTIAEMDAVNAQAEDDYRIYNVRVAATALIIGVSILGFSFWPAILAWMTPFKYGVLIGWISMLAAIIGGLAIGACLVAGRSEKRS